MLEFVSLRAKWWLIVYSLLPFLSKLMYLLLIQVLMGTNRTDMTEHGSWFITVLTKVFNEHINDMQLTDILAIVSDKVADIEHKDGWKQMPCFTSTLRKSVVFETSPTHCISKKKTIM